MKKLLLLLLISAVTAGCKKSDEKPEVKTGVSVFVYKQDKLSTGEFKDDPINSVIYIWDADGRDFEIKSLEDAIQGYAYDRVSQKSIETYIGTIGEYHFGTELPNGKYFLFVMMDQNAGIGRFTYSYTTFEVKNNWITAKKVFSYDVGSLSYESW